MRTNRNLGVAAALSFLLSACGGGGGSEADADAKPTVALIATPTSIVLGSASRLDWSSTNATSCSASGAWSGSRPISGSESVTPAAVGSATYTLSCSGDGGNASASVTLTVTAPSNKQTLTLTGFVTVAGTPSADVSGATVEVSAGSATATATSDASGAYTVTLEAQTDTVVTATASAPTGVGATATGSIRPHSFSPAAAAASAVKLSSILGSFADLAAKAGGDGRLGSEENIRNNLTQLSTAEAVLAVEANKNAEITTAEQLNAALLSIDSQKQLDLAGTLKLIIQDPDYPLPAGVGDTLAFARDAAIRDPYIADIKSTEQGQQDLDQAIEETLDDPMAVAAPTTATVPESIKLAEPVASNPVVYGNLLWLAYGFDFHADGKGSFYYAGRGSATTWTIESTRIKVVLNEPLVQTYTALNASGNDVVQVTETIGSYELIKTGEHTYELGSDVETETEGAGTTTDHVSSNLVELSVGGNIKPLPASDLSGETFAAPVFLGAYDPDQSLSPYNMPFMEDYVSFNANGTGTTRFSGQQFTYSNADDGALRLVFSDGKRLSYYQHVNVNEDAGFIYVEASLPDSTARYVDVKLIFDAPFDLHFSDSSVPGRYYQFGYGAERIPGSAIPASARDAEVSGFALRFSSDHTGAQENSDFDEPGADSSFSSSALRWSIGAEGELSVRRYYDIETGQTGCDPNAANCAQYDQRDIFPAQISRDRRYTYWIERRDFNGAPTTYLARYYEVQGADMLNGTWEVVESNGVENSDHLDVVSFFADGTVLLAANDQDPACTANGQGLQFGDYGWSPAADAQNLLSGALTATFRLNQIGDQCGLGTSEPIALNGLGELIVGEAGDQSRLRRVPSLPGQLVGAWVNGIATAKPLIPDEYPAVISFFADGRYVLADVSDDPDCDEGGVEYGRYAYDTALQEIVFHDLSLDTTDCGAVDEGGESSVFKVVEFSDIDLLLKNAEDDMVPLVKITAP